MYNKKNIKKQNLKDMKGPIICTLHNQSNGSDGSDSINNDHFIASRFK